MAKESEFCEGCKQKQGPFSKGHATQASEILEIVHSDVCGPTQEKSLDGNRYFATFTHDKSRFTAVYYMKTKDEVLEKFKKYEAMATNITGRNIKIIRSYNGGEYRPKELQTISKKKEFRISLVYP